MTSSRRRESQLRLETLGRLSGHYSDVASAALDGEDQWELDSNSSRASTEAVLFNKPPPPGVQVRKRTASHGTRPRPSGEHYVPAPGLSLADKPYAIRADADQQGTFNTSQLRPAKDLRRSQHLAISQPRVGSRTSSSEYGSDDSAGASKFPVAHHSKSQAPSYTQTAPPGNQTSRPVAVYKPLDSQQSQRSRNHAVSSVSISETPSTNYYKGRTNGYNNGDDAHHEVSIASYSHAPPSEIHRPRVPKPNNQRLSQSKPHSKPPGSTVRVNGVDFEMVPSTIAAPTPTPAPAHTPHASHGRGRQTSTSSPYPRSRSCSPAYGAWQSDHPRQRRPSFIERTQERIERSIHEHLVKAGQRPLPSFKVHKVVKVTKSPAEGELWGEGREYPPPVPPKDEWIERIEKLIVLDDAKGGGGGGRNTVAAEEARYEDWDLSPGSKAKAKAEAAFFRAQERHLKASRRPVVAGARDATFTSETRKGIPHLRINTDFRNGSVPIGTALTTPHNYSYSSAVVGSETPLEPPSFSFERGNRHEENASNRLTSSRVRDASRGSDNSLFLGRGNSAMDSPANYSFFSSEYAQKRVAADMDKYEIIQQPQQHLSTHSSADLDRGGQGEDAKSHGNRSCALSREQLGVASLPSAFEDLWQPFPFDDRCRLPSQVERQDVAAGRGSLSSNHGAK